MYNAVVVVPKICTPTGCKINLRGCDMINGAGKENEKCLHSPTEIRIILFPGQS